MSRKRDVLNLVVGMFACAQTAARILMKMEKNRRDGELVASPILLWPN